MYTQALNSGGGVAQRLNQHFYNWGHARGLSAMPFYQSQRVPFFFRLPKWQAGGGLKGARLATRQGGF